MSFLLKYVVITIIYFLKSNKLFLNIFCTYLDIPKMPGCLKCGVNQQLILKKNYIFFNPTYMNEFRGTFIPQKVGLD